MRTLLMAFASERGLKGCRVRLWTGRDGEQEGAQQRSGVLTAVHARHWGRGRRGAGWRPYAVWCRSAGSGTPRCWYAALPCGIL